MTGQADRAHLHFCHLCGGSAHTEDTGTEVLVWNLCDRCNDAAQALADALAGVQ